MDLHIEEQGTYGGGIVFHVEHYLVEEFLHPKLREVRNHPLPNWWLGLSLFGQGINSNVLDEASRLAENRRVGGSRVGRSGTVP